MECGRVERCDHRKQTNNRQNGAIADDQQGRDEEGNQPSRRLGASKRG